MQYHIIPREVADLSPAPENLQETVSISRNVKKISNVVCIALISTQVVAIIVQLAIVAVLYLYRNILGYNMNGFLADLLLGRSSLLNEISSAVTYFAYMFVPFLLIAFILKHHPFKIVPIKAIRSAHVILPALALALSFAFFSDLVTTYIQTFLGFLHLSSTSPDFTPPTSPSSFSVFFFQICILAPLLEEFLFRGVILHSLKRFGNAFAVVVSALLFSMVHGNLLQIPLAFILGFLFGVVVVKTGSIWLTVLLHATINTESTLVNLLAGHNVTLANLTYLGIAVLSILFTLTYLLYYFSKHPFREVTASFKQAVLPNSFLLKRFFATPGFIVFLVVTIGFIVLYTTVI